MKKNQKKINWKLSKDGEELIIRVRVATLVHLVLDQQGFGKRELGVSDMAGKMLTRREREVLPYLFNGMVYKDVAKALGSAERTIKYHAHGIFKKLHVHNRGELMALRFTEKEKGDGDEKKQMGHTSNSSNGTIAIRLSTG